VLEFERFAIPVPDLQLLLRVPPSVAAARAASRERADPTRIRDSYESDDGLQRRCARVYDRLAERSWVSPWRVVDGAGRGRALTTAAADLAAELDRLAAARCDAID
jgi:dTMP kinase